MRKTWKLALASAALVSGVAFTACSSDDEELLSGGSDTTTVPGEVDEVKTTISFAITPRHNVLRPIMCRKILPFRVCRISTSCNFK